MQLAEFLDVGLHMLPAEDILGNSKQMGTLGMLAISGVEHTLTGVDSAEIGSLGRKNLFGTRK